MKIGVVDVGSNTVRLLVASVGGGEVRSLREERAHLGLGEEILRHGRVRRRKLEELAVVATEFGRIAREHRVRQLETVVTAPGRQGDAPERLLQVLARATGGPVRIVSAEDEGRLAYTGAVARTDVGDEVVAVCDVGGGSTELVVGTALLGPAWVRSLDVGSLRLTASLLHGDPPTAAEIERARASVREALSALEPPHPGRALGTGGSARALARIVGGAYDADALQQVIELLASRPAELSAAQLAIPLHRARTLLAGALVLAEVSRLLGVELAPAKGGIREGVALRLASERAAA
ncbi:MAG: hypothetical protein MSC30_04735 [Gaiellaceae bacterium MAG52_C11]|nr:hypothetical protein [Candidatus Gaiellasilicea maunaloa]